MSKLLPINFTPELQAAVNNDDKTRTMRPIRPQPPEGTVCYHNGLFMQKGSRLGVIRTLPWQPGDVLYLRERARVVDIRCYGVKLKYETDGQCSGWTPYPDRLKPIKVGHCIPNGCFREACRIHLRVLNVTVHRLQDIEDTQCRAEGWREECLLSHRYWMMRLWNKIYAKRGLGWDTNPWVVAADFERIK